MAAFVRSADGTSEEFIVANANVITCVSGMTKRAFSFGMFIVCPDCPSSSNDVTTNVKLQNFMYCQTLLWIANWRGALEEKCSGFG